MTRNKLFILLVIVIILPSLIFTSFEISRLNESKMMINEIYRSQLSTIEYSVNQYSNDIISSWAEKINWFYENFKYPDDTLKQYLESKRQIINIYYISSNSIYPLIKTSTIKIKLLEGFLKNNQDKLNKNRSYLNANYRKNEHIGNTNSDNDIFIAFWTGNDINTAKLCVIELNTQRFIKEIIAPKVQGSLENKFLVAIFDKSNDSIVFYSGSKAKVPAFNFRKDFWLFPQYQLAVEIKDVAIEELVKNRARNNIILLAIVEALFILGTILIFNYSRKEVRLARLKSEFISNVSHEIRTPLALVSMYVETLDMERITERSKIKEYYNVILLEVQRLTSIVNNILNFSKLESGKKSYNFEKISFKYIIDEVLNTYNFHLKNKGFNLILENSASLPECLIDKSSMTDVLVNLIDNAMKYSNTVKEIKVKTGFDDKFVFTEISDKGIGIAKDEQKLIFSQFYRVTKGNLAHHAKGTGLGLSIVKYIIDAHKGKIEVESSLGKGSTFRIKLPI
jgi:two-component system phosphate regulon sensor histidine kinase PhoR